VRELRCVVVLQSVYGEMQGHRTAALMVTFLLSLTMILMPPQIRPAAYNQLPPSIARIVAERRGAASRDGQLLDDSERDTTAEIPTELDASLLAVFVVFHRALHDQLYRGLRIPHADVDVTRARGENATTLLLNHGITFVATNPAVKKTVNATNPLYDNRVVAEWETAGYDSCTGARLNEYGAMGSIFASDWTLSKKSTGDITAASAKRAAFLLDVSFVGVFQYDMRIDVQLLDLLRRRIRRNRRQRGAQAGVLQLQHAGGMRHVDHSLRMSPRHRLEQRAKDPHGFVESADTRCCLFYSVSHPTPYLLGNALGRQLLREYNSFFSVAHTMSSLHRVSVLDAFVMPYADFNAMMPFLLAVMRNLTRSADGACAMAGEAQGTYEAVVRGGPPPPPLDVMERALALSLAVLDIDFVPMPLKHEKMEEHQGP
jgi:hypothetical protein